MKHTVLYYFVVTTFIIVGLSNNLHARERFSYPEAYGAIGDGIHDDSPAFSKCIESGRSLRLKEGKTYLLKSKISPINKTSFSIIGNNSSIIIDKTYPTERYDQIFRFSDRSYQKSLVVKDVSIKCNLEDKFKGDHDAIGDTYIFFVTQCDKVSFTHVQYECTTLYNNTSFLVSWGTKNTIIEDCNVVQNTLSKQGGIFWLMNRSVDKCSVQISRCYFEQDDHDELMCLSANKDKDCQINAIITDCTFSSNCKSPSSGFIISYNQAKDVFSDIDITYNNCVFKAIGKNMRRIQTYQCGWDPASDYGIFNAKYNDCTFEFNIEEPSGHGILGLLPLEQNNVKKEHICHSFDKCVFNITGDTPIIADKDGNIKGCFIFNDCDIKSNSKAFQKLYNERGCDIDLIINNSNVLSADEVLATVNLHSSNTKYRNIKSKEIIVAGVSYGKTHSISLNDCTLNKREHSTIHNDSHPLYVYSVIDPQNSIVGDIYTGSIVYGKVNDGRTCNIYYYSPKLKETVVCVLNGKSFPMQYIEKEKTYYTNLKFSNNAYKIGSNRIQVFDKIIDFTISD